MGAYARECTGIRFVRTCVYVCKHGDKSVCDGLKIYDFRGARKDQHPDINLDYDEAMVKA